MENREVQKLIRLYLKEHEDTAPCASDLIRILQNDGWEVDGFDVRSNLLAMVSVGTVKRDEENGLYLVD